MPATSSTPGTDAGERSSSTCKDCSAEVQRPQWKAAMPRTKPTVMQIPAAIKTLRLVRSLALLARNAAPAMNNRPPMAPMYHQNVATSTFTSTVGPKAAPL